MLMTAIPTRSFVPAITAERIREIIRVRRMRELYLGADLFADPVWDMLLDLTAADLEGKRVTVTSACAAAAVPPTTALRWLKTLTQNGLVLRTSDPDNRRRVFLSPSEPARRAVIRLLECFDGHDSPW